jgi:hypothetical protein
MRTKAMTPSNRCDVAARYISKAFVWLRAFIVISFSIYVGIVVCVLFVTSFDVFSVTGDFDRKAAVLVEVWGFCYDKYSVRVCVLCIVLALVGATKIVIEKK